MKTKKIIRLFVLVTIIFTILYLLLASKPLAKEYQYTPVWIINTSNPVVKQASDNDSRIHFHLGQTLGFFTPDGDITLYKTFPAKVSISDNFKDKAAVLCCP